ncbi:unnamed protein product [Cyclocybe aegerita]|uniref:Uncharacterized protein n=1 Tax=Cyclocybe aegerita TaxID=1973307 RepID=A0A8S0VS68_CYCAE|nr:unnamed protein product [Cyclocybe aegerita]
MLPTLFFAHTNQVPLQIAEFMNSPFPPWIRFLTAAIPGLHDGKVLTRRIHVLQDEINAILTPIQGSIDDFQAILVVKLEEAIKPLKDELEARFLTDGGTPPLPYVALMIAKLSDIVEDAIVNVLSDIQGSTEERRAMFIMGAKGATGPVKGTIVGVLTSLACLVEDNPLIGRILTGTIFLMLKTQWPLGLILAVLGFSVKGPREGTLASVVQRLFEAPAVSKSHSPNAEKSSNINLEKGTLKSKRKRRIQTKL